jgi:hypothetical protein
MEINDGETTLLKDVDQVVLQNHERKRKKDGVLVCEWYGQ